MRLIVVVCFQDEARFLPRFLTSVERQTRPPDRLVLVDDGSRDDSARLAAEYTARHRYAVVRYRSPRRREADRLVRAAELEAFEWAVAGLNEPFDVIAKVDADLELNPTHFERMLAEIGADLRLGIAGAVLSDVAGDGSAAPLPAPSHHVPGATKFYRRECYEQILPIPAHLGWDMIDTVKARRAGWRTESFRLAGGDTLHLRPTGAQDGVLRAYGRWGACAWGYGAHPLFVLLGVIKRMSWRPRVVGGAAYGAGYCWAALRGVPRVDSDVRSFIRQEEARQVRDLLRSPLPARS